MQQNTWILLGITHASDYIPQLVTNVFYVFAVGIFIWLVHHCDALLQYAVRKSSLMYGDVITELLFKVTRVINALDINTRIYD